MDSRSVGQIFDRHFGSVHRYLERRTGRETADALSADVMLIAFQERLRYDLTRSSCRPWLYGIAAHVSRRHWRSSGRRSRALERLPLHASALEESRTDALIDRLDSEELLERLMVALARLPDVEREVLQLAAWEQLTYDEIAVAVGVPIGTVRSRISRPRRRLRHLVQLPPFVPPSTTTERPSHA